MRMSRTGSILFGLVALAATLGAAPPRSAAQEQEDAVPQRDFFDLLQEWLFGKRVEPRLEVTRETGLQWAAVPTFSYNPVYGAAFGALVVGAGHRGSLESAFSSLAVSANYSTEEQLQIQVRGDVFSPSEDYLLSADVRYLDTDRSTWGLGEVRDGEDEYPMAFVLGRAYVTVLRRARDPVYIGVGAHYDQFWDIVDERAATGETTPFAAYSRGTPSSTEAVGVSFNVLADTRDNQVNPASGYYLNWSFRNYMSTLGSDKNWQEAWIESRMYPQLPTRSGRVLAFWLYGWMTFGPAPYLNLPSNGWDKYGRGARGYLAGRIRGSSQVYGETEYRWSLTRDGLLGAVVFLNATATTSPGTGTFGRLDPGAGAGLRIKFNKHSNANLTLDYAWGRADSHGLFMGMNEAF